VHLNSVQCSRPPWQAGHQASATAQPHRDKRLLAYPGTLLLRRLLPTTILSPPLPCRIFPTGPHQHSPGNDQENQHGKSYAKKFVGVIDTVSYRPINQRHNTADGDREINPSATSTHLAIVCKIHSSGPEHGFAANGTNVLSRFTCPCITGVRVNDCSKARMLLALPTPRFVVIRFLRVSDLV